MDEKEVSDNLSNMIQGSVVMGLYKTLVPWETHLHQTMENALRNNSVHEVQNLLTNALVNNLTNNSSAMRQLSTTLFNRMMQLSRSM